MQARGIRRENANLGQERRHAVHVVAIAGT
jgi:hypothetical protein